MDESVSARESAHWEAHRRSGRYGISRWRLSTRRSAARRGKLAVVSSAPSAVVDSESPPSFAALEMVIADMAPSPWVAWSASGAYWDRKAGSGNASMLGSQLFKTRGMCSPRPCWDEPLADADTQGEVPVVLDLRRASGPAAHKRGRHTHALN